MPPASRIEDLHDCPEHGGGAITEGCPTVIVGFSPQSRAKDQGVCEGAEVHIAKGWPTVIVGGREAARVGDPTDHGGELVTGCPTVIIGTSAQLDGLFRAAKNGTPFLDPKSCLGCGPDETP